MAGSCARIDERQEAVARSHAIALPLSGILREGGWLRLLPAVTLAVFLLPVVAGLAGTLLPAFGYLPGLGATQPSLAPVRAHLSAPELPAAVIATLLSGLLATLLSFLAAVAIAAGLHGTRSFAWLRRM